MIQRLIMNDLPGTPPTKLDAEAPFPCGYGDVGCGKDCETPPGCRDSLGETDPDAQWACRGTGDNQSQMSENSNEAETFEANTRWPATVTDIVA